MCALAKWAIFLLLQGKSNFSFVLCINWRQLFVRVYPKSKTQNVTSTVLRDSFKLVYVQELTTQFIARTWGSWQDTKGEAIALQIELCSMPGEMSCGQM